jgi:hypothetical protein
MEWLVDWGWLWAPRRAVLRSALNEDECMSRLRDEVHCAPLTPREKDVIGSVGVNDAILERRRYKPPLSRAVHASPRLEVTVRRSTQGVRIECLSFFGIGTTIYVIASVTFTVAVLIYVIANTTRSNAGYGLFSLVLVGGFALVNAVSLKAEAGKDAGYLLGFVEKLLHARPLG